MLSRLCCVLVLLDVEPQNTDLLQTTEYEQSPLSPDDNDDTGLLPTDVILSNTHDAPPLPIDALPPPDSVPLPPDDAPPTPNDAPPTTDYTPPPSDDAPPTSDDSSSDSIEAPLPSNNLPFIG